LRLNIYKEVSMKKHILITVIVLFSVFKMNSQASNIKGAIIYKLSSLVEWSSPKSSLTIGVYGKTDVFAALKTISEFASGGKEVKVIKVKSNAEIGKCDIVFFAPKSSQDVVNAVGNNILVVTDGESSTKKSWCINLVSKTGRLTYEVNRSNLTKKSLKGNATLYKLASKTHG